MKHPWTGLKNIPRNIWLVSSVTLINRAGTMVLPFVALYAKQELNVTTGEAGLVLAFYGIGALISSPFSGKLSDNIGPLKLMTISLISSGLFLFLYSVVKDFKIFLGLSLVWAILNEAFRPASMSFISSEITPDRRKTAFALNRLAINLGMSIGPVIGGILSTINFSLLFYVDGITSLAAGSFLILSHWQKHEAADERDGVKDTVEVVNKVSLMKTKKFLYFILAFIPVQIVFFQHIGALPLFIVNELGFSNAIFGYLIAINTVLIIFVEVPLNDAMRTWESHKSLALGALLSALGFGFLAFSEDIPPIILLIVIWTFGEMILFPASGDYVASVSPEKQRGEYMGYFQMSFSFSFMVGPWLGAEALDHFGSLSLWLGCFVLGMISAFMLFRLKGEQHHHKL